MSSVNLQPLLEDAHVALLREPVSISIAARDARCIPTVVRALGLRLTEDRQRLTVLVSGSSARALLACLQNNGAIAMVIGRPATHRTIQLKGTDATIEPALSSDHALVARHRDAFIQELLSIGYKQPFVSGVLPASPDELTAVTFTPTAAFEQTPGPAAGQRLQRSS